MWAAEAGVEDDAPPAKRALVPDSFVVLVRAEGEREADAKERLERYLEWMEAERERQEREMEEGIAEEEG